MPIQILYEDFKNAVELEIGNARLITPLVYPAFHCSLNGRGDKTMGTGPALVFFRATFKFRSGPYSSACSK